MQARKVAARTSRKQNRRPDRPAKPAGEIVEEKKIRQSFSIPYAFPIIFTQDALHPDNDTFDTVFSAAADGLKRKVLVCIDVNVANSWPDLPERIRRRLERLMTVEMAGEPLLVPGGEQAKNGLKVVELVGREAARRGIDRQAYVLAIGGGAILDAVGLGAALVHRGLKLVRMPTTVLAQNDAGIGVKNGVNALGQKNFFGTFAPPQAVVNDAAFLATLTDRDWRSGIAEAVKVAAIKDLEFFRYLEAHVAGIAARDSEKMETLIRRCARLHVEHTGAGGDPFELGSARPLDFGHWSAHWLEMASGGEILHGEAVALGVAIDTLYAGKQGLVSPEEAGRVRDCLLHAGFCLWHELLERIDGSGTLAVLAGLEHFREHLGGELTITLPRPLGRRVEVHALDLNCLTECIAELKALNLSAP